MDYLLRAGNITKQYANHLALKDVSVDVPRQSIFGLLGPNGAGKTTFIRIINQIIAPDTGTISFNGFPLSTNDIYRIGYLPEERGLYKKMKVGEQALYLAQLKGLSKQDATKKLKKWFEKFEIGNWWNRKVEELSKGMQQKIQFVVTVLHQPELLIFDEPFSGFDPINVNLLKDEILDLKKNGATIIFSTHNMASVEELCDHIALIDNSKKILEGNVLEIKENMKENLYEVEYMPSGKPLENILNNNFRVISNIRLNSKMLATIKILNNGNQNQLLQSLIPETEIFSFTEILPSMNDIFIRTVEKNKSKKEH
ncbi:MAG: ATP-binding cassette domain-containing protein [Bacteroidales bacterium]|nr:ATP-binding cassette domain-containing protein [Bacteroidales bacterium]MCF8404785.1 ATP-binding cassette domain-containing protein [Bacteroidales bacterium]